MQVSREDGASAVEMALIAPLLFMLVFGIIEFGVAFLQIQSMRTAVREGGRAAAVGYQVNDVRSKTVNASSGSIPSSQSSNIAVSPSQCTPNNIGSDITVSFDTSNLPGGGVIVRIPFVPDIVMDPVISAGFRCEV